MDEELRMPRENYFNKVDWVFSSPEIVAFSPIAELGSEKKGNSLEDGDQAPE